MRELNGDYKLTRFEQVQYLFFNLIGGIWGYRTYIHTKFWVGSFKYINKHTPGRHYLDSFLYQEIPKLLKNKQISILDIGCGTGYIRKILSDLGYSGKYIGIDIDKEKKFDDFNTDLLHSEFIKLPIEEFKSEEKFDLVISMTSFEHIPDDKKAAEQANYYVKDDGIQVHILPSFWSLPVYLFHGLRQYSPNRLENIFNLTNENTTIYRLGGLGSFITAFILMTCCERFLGIRKIRETNFYRKLIVLSSKLDMFLPFCGQIYVVVILNKHEN